MPAQLSVSAEPVEGGAVVYAPLAPPTAGGSATMQLSLKLLFTNSGTTSAHVTGVALAFTNPAASTVSMPLDLMVDPGDTVDWHMSPAQYVLLALPGPGSITITVSTGDSAAAASLTKPLAAHSNPVSGGSYPFPAKASDLRVGEYWSGRSGTHKGAGDGSQMFAYDMAVIAWDAAAKAWSRLLPGTDTKKNENFRIWGKPIYAALAGTVVDFRNDIPTNPTPGSDLAPPNPVEGNHFYLQHGPELLLYAHLQPGSLNPALLKKGAAVSAGQFLGLAGNSGNSSEPHLHVHAIKGTKPWGGPPRPVLWRDVQMIDRTALVPPSPAGPWVAAQDQALPKSAAALWPLATAPTWYPPGWAEIARHGISAKSYQSEFDKITSSGYRPVWVDGYDVNGSTFLNAIFRPVDGTPWVARHGLNADQYQAEWDTWVKEKKYRPLHVEVYLADGAVRYAAIYVKTAGPEFTAYHGRSAAEHQKLFDDLTGQGFRPVNISATSVLGSRVYAALYEKRNVGSFVAKSFLTPAEYQVEFDANTAAGRHLVYVNAYTHLTGPRLIGIWWQSAPGASARHGLSSAAYQAQYDAQLAAGRLTRGVAGYEQGDEARFIAFWSKA